MKGIFVSLLFLTFSLTSSAQERTYLGAYAGWQTGSVYIEHSIYQVILQAGYIQGANGGVVLKHFSEHKQGKLNTGVQLGLNFSQRGWRQNFASFDSTSTTRMDYLQIPVSAIIYAGKPQNRIFITMTFFGEMLVQSKSGRQPEGLDPREDFYTYNADRDKEFGYGLRGGLGYQKDIGPGAIMAEAFFSYSISNFIGFENRAVETPDISQLFNIGINVGYLIPLK